MHEFGARNRPIATAMWRLGRQVRAQCLARAISSKAPEPGSLLQELSAAWSGFDALPADTKLSVMDMAADLKQREAVAWGAKALSDVTMSEAETMVTLAETRGRNQMLLKELAQAACDEDSDTDDDREASDDDDDVSAELDRIRGDMGEWHDQMASMKEELTAQVNSVVDGLIAISKEAADARREQNHVHERLQQDVADCRTVGDKASELSMQAMDQASQALAAVEEHTETQQDNLCQALELLDHLRERVDAFGVQLNETVAASDHQDSEAADVRHRVQQVESRMRDFMNQILHDVQKVPGKEAGPAVWREMATVYDNLGQSRKEIEQLRSDVDVLAEQRDEERQSYKRLQGLTYKALDRVDMQKQELDRLTQSEANVMKLFAKLGEFDVDKGGSAMAHAMGLLCG